MPADPRNPDNLPRIDLVLPDDSGGLLGTASTRTRRPVAVAGVLEIVRTHLSAQLEHFLAYAGAAAIAMAGYGSSRGNIRIIGGLWIFAGVLEYLRLFSPGRHPSIEDFAASAFGALCGGLAVALLWRRPSDQPG